MLFVEENHERCEDGHEEEVDPDEAEPLLDELYGSAAS